MHFLTRVEKLMDIPPAEKALVMRELRSHYFETKEELMASGMGALAAEQEAERRLGEPEDVAARMGPVYNIASWKSALIGLIPYFIGIVASMRILQVRFFGADIIKYIVLILLGLIALGTIRESASGRRPIWLTSWLAASIVAPTVLIMMFAGAAVNGWITIVYVAVPSIICLLFAIRSQSKWRTPALVCVIISILCIIIRLSIPLPYSNNVSVIMSILTGLLPIILPIFIALIVFMENSYSNAIQASLFLFAIFTYHIYSFNMFAMPTSYLYSCILSNLIFAGAWLLCVRTPLKQMKYFAMIAGLIMTYMWLVVRSIIYRMSAGIVIDHTMIASVALSFLPGILISFLVVFTPIIIERRRNKQNLQAVQ